ncbi:MAG: hypothetical protein ACK5OB_04070 [Pirellula sp.]
MNDFVVVATRVLLTVFAPFMLLVPLGVVVAMPNRATSDAKRALAKRLQWTLVGFTLLALATSLGLSWIAASGSLPVGHPLQQIAMHCWVLFFPLWFGLAMPCVQAKLPATQGAGNATSLGGMQGETRTASLVNRLRQHPLQKWEWIVGGAISIACLSLIAARGLVPFPTEEPSGASQGAFLRWLLALGIYAACVVLQWIIVPISLRAMLLEPEPMDAEGSPELQEAYSNYRKQKGRVLYWMLAVIQPVFLGGMIAVMVWMPGRTPSLGLVGGIGGTLLGLCGAAFGSLMTHRRLQIDKLRLELDRPHRAAGSQPS